MHRFRRAVIQEPAALNQSLMLSCEKHAMTTRYIDALHALRAGKSRRAIEALRAILAADPDHAGARRNLARAYLAIGDWHAVLDATIAPSAEALYLRGTALNALSRHEEARAALAEAVARDPGFAPAWLNLGNALMDLDDLPGAEAHCRQAMTLDPTLLEAPVSLGFVLTAQGRVREAISVLERAVTMDPAHVQAHWNLAVACLLAGDLPRGFALYEWRKRHDRFRRDFIDLPGPVWDGGDPAGRTILVHAEQGFGDTIQFARYLPLIARRGGRPVLACERPLIPLLSRLPDVTVVPKDAPLPPHDAWIDQMSLPRVFGTRLDTVPSPDGYLPGWRRRDGPVRTVGLAWRGNPLHGNDRRRTPPSQVFAPLPGLPGVRFVSLVPGETLAGTAPAALDDYAATARVIAGLDLVISVDTSVAHLAGAMGCPAWVLLPFAPDWRWLIGRSDSPWYRSLRLFRQPAPGAWGPVIQAVIAALLGAGVTGLQQVP